MLADIFSESLVITDRLYYCSNFLFWVSTIGESCTGNSFNCLNTNDLMNQSIMGIVSKYLIKKQLN